METFIIGRSYNKHGVSDYYMGKDDAHVAAFAGKARAQVFTNRNTAYGMTIRLKRLLPTIMGGNAASYSVVEVA